MAKYNQRLEALEKCCTQVFFFNWAATNETPDEATARAGPYEGITVVIGWQNSKDAQ